MFHTVDVPRTEPPTTPPGLVPVRVVPFSTALRTAACRVCGCRLHLTDDELIASFTEAPICWPCDVTAVRITGP